MHIPKMFARSFLPALALAMAGTGVHADTEDWKKIGSWDVSFYPGSKGCQAYALFDQETAFFIGFDNNENALSLDITLLDETWQEIEAGKEYPIELRFGDQTPWTLSMSGIRMDGYPGLHAMIDAKSLESDVFIEEFQQESRMAWRHDDELLGGYTLNGSRNAFEEVIACQRSHFETTETAVVPNSPMRSLGDPNTE